jgi:hypothetical protein
MQDIEIPRHCRRVITKKKKKHKFWTVLNLPEIEKNRLEAIPNGLLWTV